MSAFFSGDAVLRGIAGGLDQLTQVFEERKVNKQKAEEMRAIYEMAIKNNASKEEAIALALNPDSAKAYATIRAMDAQTRATIGEEDRAAALFDGVKTLQSLTIEQLKEAIKSGRMQTWMATLEAREKMRVVDYMRTHDDLTPMEYKTVENWANQRTHQTSEREAAQTFSAGEGRLNRNLELDLQGKRAKTSETVAKIAAGRDEYPGKQMSDFRGDVMAAYKANLSLYDDPVKLSPEERSSILKQSIDEVRQIQEATTSIFSGPKSRGGGGAPPAGVAAPPASPSDQSPSVLDEDGTFFGASSIAELKAELDQMVADGQMPQAEADQIIAEAQRAGLK